MLFAKKPERNCSARLSVWTKLGTEIFVMLPGVVETNALRFYVVGNITDLSSRSSPVNFEICFNICGEAKSGEVMHVSKVLRNPTIRSNASSQSSPMVHPVSKLARKSIVGVDCPVVYVGVAVAATIARQAIGARVTIIHL